MVIGTVDPNPRHAGRGLRILKRAGLTVELACEVEEEAEAVQRGGRIAGECIKLNEAFNHWIVHRTPFVTVKAAMTLDGKIATATGESKWITGERARAEGMKMRKKSDAILVGVNTVLADDPSLTVRPVKNSRLRRIILDSRARTPLKSRLVSDEFAHLTTIVVGKHAPENRVKALARRIRVLRAPVRKTGIDLKWLLKRLGREQVTHLLVEGGGEVNTSFLMNGMAHRVCFFYAPKIVGGGDSHRAVAGAGARELKDFRRLKDLKWRRLGEDLMLTARVV
jgi:diaminohydroxyphosphoribosylaminopyrimidine deaminase/5-amino-6-(5-phosphoribosylamino)uracil reductase